MKNEPIDWKKNLQRVIPEALLLRTNTQFNIKSKDESQKYLRAHGSNHPCAETRNQVDLEKVIVDAKWEAYVMGLKDGGGLKEWESQINTKSRSTGA